jgi:hypothetical protein
MGSVEMQNKKISFGVVFFFGLSSSCSRNPGIRESGNPRVRARMLFGLLDSPWFDFAYYYALPVYTYWYIFGPLLVLLAPLLGPVFRLSIGTVKYFVGTLLLMCAEVVDFLVESTTSTPSKRRRRHPSSSSSSPESEDREDYTGQRRLRMSQRFSIRQRTTTTRRNVPPEDTSEEEEAIEENEENELDSGSYDDAYRRGVSAEDIFDNLQNGVTKMARICILLLILLLPIWFAISMPFLYYNNHAECHQDHLGHMNNVKECEERGYSAPAFRKLCIHSKKEVQKSVVYCALQGTMRDLQLFFWNTISSPYVIVYLCLILVLVLGRSGVRLAKRRDHDMRGWYTTKEGDYGEYGEYGNGGNAMKNVTLYREPPKQCTIHMGPPPH